MLILFLISIVYDVYTQDLSFRYFTATRVKYASGSVGAICVVTAGYFSLSVVLQI